MSQLFSIETEQSLLGCLLSDNTCFDRVADLVASDDFARKEHQLTFTAISFLINSMKPADPVTVYSRLVETGDEKDAGGLQYINSLANSISSIRSARRYAEIVSEKAILRNVAKRLSEAAELIEGAGALSDKLDSVAGLFTGLDAGNAKKAPQHIDQVLGKVIDSINDAAEGRNHGISTGVGAIDRKLNGGFLPGKLVILAARPSVGKTSLALQIGKHIALAGIPVLALSQEMENDELTERAIANESMVDYGRLQSGRLNYDDWSRLAEGVDKLAKSALWIDDEPGLTLQAINSKARSIKGLKVLILDYIQLSEGEGDTRSAQVGSISRGLKKLAKQLGITVIALSQLNREVDKRPGRRPQMSDLRDSGEIEQDADTVLFLWPLSQDEDNTPIRHIGCAFEKNRKGQKGTFVFEFEGAKQKWHESIKNVEDFSKSTGRGFE